MNAPTMVPSLWGESPVAIGGVGGSGTRVVAQIVRDLGFHVGEDLNDALDNLWFTLLMRRSSVAGAPPAALAPGIELFAAAMRGAPVAGSAELDYMRRAQRETIELMEVLRPDQDWSLWASRREQSLLAPAGPPPGSVGWGWKEPCAHVFLEPLVELLPGMRYIHVIRDGRELAHSMLTQLQLTLWGRAYGIEPPADFLELDPAVLLRFWVRANRRALELGPALLGERFLLLRYESICGAPAAAVERIAGFLGVPASAAEAERIASFVRDAPPSRRRPARFDPADLAAVESLGFAR